MRAEDILISARYATEHVANGSPASVDMVAMGKLGVPALHAAALEPELFASVKLVRTLVSWASVIERRVSVKQYGNVIQGALLDYDLPNLADSLGRKLTIEEPVDAAGKPVPSK
jgi:hypothetical protein